MRGYDSNTNNPDTDQSESLLFEFGLPSIRRQIQKEKKCCQSAFARGKFFLYIEKVKSKIPSYKRPLTIRIPSDTEVKPLAPANNLGSLINCADANELGYFHGVLLKKGDYRRLNEDRVIALQQKQFLTCPYFAGSYTNFMAGIFDGHGGGNVAQYLAEQFAQRFLSYYCISPSVTNTFLNTFEALESEINEMVMNKEISENEGATAIAVLLLNNELHLAYIGDSEAILIKETTGELIELCPELDLAGKNMRETDRIMQAGGIILKVGQAERVQGELEVTRSFGATKYKPYIVAQPHLGYCDIEKGDFLVMASDGLWKVMKKEEVFSLVVKYKEAAENEIAEKLYEEAIKKEAKDNITIVVVNLQKRRQMLKRELSGPPPAPTSKYAKQNNKAFVFQ